MNKTVSTAILAAIVGVGGFAPLAYAAHDDDDRRAEERSAEDRREHGEYRQALTDLKQAREALATADSNWNGRRQQALTQTNYAIEQVYAALGDDAAKKRDQQVAARELQEGKDRRGDREDRDSVDRQRKQMNAAMDHLYAARKQLIRVPTDDSRRQKSIDFTEQAIKDIQTAVAGIDKSR